MLSWWKIVGLILLLFSLSGKAEEEEIGNWDRGYSGPVEPFAPGYEVISFDKGSGELTLKFTITYYPDAYLKADCDELMMVLYPFDGLVNKGEDTLYVPYGKENPYTVLLNLTLPPNDTSYLVFREQCGKTAYHYGITFITIDTLVADWGTGGRDRALGSEWGVRHWPDPQSDYERAKREWEERQKELKHVGRGVTGRLPREGSEGDTLEGPPSRGLTLDSLRKLEENPLTEATAQVVQVGETLYIRHRGESKFEVMETYGSREEAMHASKNRPPDLSKRVHIVLDLRKQEDYDFAKGVVDSLVPMERAGYYHTVVGYFEMEKLRQRHIRQNHYPYYPGELPPPPAPRDSSPSPRTKPRRVLEN